MRPEESVCFLKRHPDRQSNLSGLADNIEALDRFVGAHILKGVKSIKELDGAYENFNGDMVAIETNATGERVCGGARLLNQEIETDYGLVIPVVGMVEDIRWN